MGFVAYGADMFAATAGQFRERNEIRLGPETAGHLNVVPLRVLLSLLELGAERSDLGVHWPT